MSQSSPTSIKRVVVASFVGTTIEWYDFFLYGTAAATVFDKLFFPNVDPYLAKMAAFATFAIGFFARPLGGIVFGHFGDKIGRKSMLVTTLMMMGIATVLIGLLPTYSQIGIAAPILLIALRFVQGFGVGGEWGGAVLMAVEHGHAGKRGFHASWVQAGVPVGLLLANGVYSLTHGFFGETSFMNWAWRIPFLLGVLLLGVGMFIRLKIMESPIFAEAKAADSGPKVPILAVIRDHPRNVLLAMGARFAENAFFYIFTVLILSYGSQLGMAKPQLFNAVLLASAVQLVVIPAFGALSDRVGRRPVYLGGAIFLALFAFPFFWLVETRQTGLVVLAVVVGLIGHAAMYGPQAAFFSELFGTRVRYSGASLGYQLASPLAGGLAPLIATALLDKFNGQSWPVAVYLLIMSAITLVSVYLAEETSRKGLS